MRRNGRNPTLDGRAVAERDAGRLQGPTTFRSRLAEVFLATAQAAASGRGVLTSSELSRYAGHSGEQVRRDLQSMGVTGKRGVGYDVDRLLARLEGRPGLRSPVALIGGNGFGAALLESSLLQSLGIEVAAVFERDPPPARRDRIRREVLPLSRLGEEVAARRIEAAVLATPASEVEEAYDAVCAAGVRLVVSFPSRLLEKRDGVAVHYAHAADRLLRAIALSPVRSS